MNCQYWKKDINSCIIDVCGNFCQLSLACAVKVHSMVIMCYEVGKVHLLVSFFKKVPSKEFYGKFQTMKIIFDDITYLTKAGKFKVRTMAAVLVVNDKI